MASTTQMKSLFSAITINSLIITATIKDIQDFNGLFDPIGNDGTALKRHGSQTFYQVVTRPTAMWRIPNLAASRRYPADKLRSDTVALTG